MSVGCGECGEVHGFLGPGAAAVGGRVGPVGEAGVGGGRDQGVRRGGLVDWGGCGGNVGMAGRVV